MLDFEYNTLFVSIAICILAGLIRGFAGFGSAMMLAPVYSILYGPLNMIALVMLMELGVSVGLVRGALRDVEWKFVRPLSITAILFLPVGTILLTYVDSELLTRIIAGIVVLFVLFMMSGWRFRGKKRLTITIGLGAISGTMIATTSMGGPPVLAYMLSGPDNAITNRANIIIYFALTGGALLAVLALRGLIEPKFVLLALILTPIFTLAGVLGAQMFQKSSEQIYRKIAFSVLLLTGIFGLIR